MSPRPAGFAPIWSSFSRDRVARLAYSSRYGVLRRLADPRNGIFWYWRAEEATHAEAARHLGFDWNGDADVAILDTGPKVSIPPDQGLTPTHCGVIPYLTKTLLEPFHSAGLPTKGGEDVLLAKLLTAYLDEHHPETES